MTTNEKPAPRESRLPVPVQQKHHSITRRRPFQSTSAAATFTDANAVNAAPDDGGEFGRAELPQERHADLGLPDSAPAGGDQ